jgi:para-nitrobenzyl esterase
MPEWTPYSTERGEVMILDDTCELAEDPDREARNMLP